MYRATESLSPLLGADDYTTVAAHEHDVRHLRDRTWQLVGSASQLVKDGDFISTLRLGVPILVRNFGGQLVALQNVCAHRQCRLVDRPAGNASELKCPYHGWRYGADGLTRKLPGAHNFPHFSRENYRLTSYEVRQIGQLVFVQVADSVEPLDRWNEWSAMFDERTKEADWRLILEDEIDFPCDWKIPIEGSLESYHLSELHAGTLGDDPGEKGTEHRFQNSGTTFSTRHREASFLASVEERVVARLCDSFDPLYQHVHVFPNVMASFTSSLSLVYQIFPAEPQKSTMKVLGFVPRGDRRLTSRWLSRGLGIAAKSFARKVLNEDARIFPEVQFGMTHRREPRIFGRCEERLHAFHVYWAQTHTHDERPE